jgi:hypothetical protein
VKWDFLTGPTKAAFTSHKLIIIIYESKVKNELSLKIGQWNKIRARTTTMNLPQLAATSDLL